MKKVKALLFVLVLAMITLCGCSGGEDSSSSAVDFSTVKQKLDEGFDFSELYSIPDAEELSLTYSFEEADVSDFYAKYSVTGIDSQEIIIVKAANNDAAERIKTALETRYKSKVNEAASYSPEQLELVQKCSVRVDGDIVSLVVDKNADAIHEIIIGKF